MAALGSMTIDINGVLDNAAFEYLEDDIRWVNGMAWMARNDPELSAIRMGFRVRFRGVRCSD